MKSGAESSWGSHSKDEMNGREWPIEIHVKKLRNEQ